MIDGLSIIIPAYNEEHYLPKLLESISKQDFHKKLQVIVVDGKSEDKTKKVADRYKNKVVDLTVLDSDRGIGVQKNQGVKLAKYRYLLFLDADCILPKNFLNKLTNKIKTTESFVATTYIWPISKNILDFLVIALAYPLVYIARLLNPLASGACTFTTKDNHEKIHGYIEGVRFGEDNDYAERSVIAGAKYYSFFDLYIYSSVRRAKELGRIGLLWHWFKMYSYAKKHGLEEANKKYEYKYGHYKGD